MKIKAFGFSYIKSFRSLRLDLDRTRVLIGQNDHGKSSILKAIDIVLNRLDADTVARGALHPDLAELLLPAFPVKAKARRITIAYESGSGKRKDLHITVRSDLTFTVVERVERNAKTTPAAIELLKGLQTKNRFVLIPALRDASSSAFQDLFSRMLREHGLSGMIPQRAGGTPKEYRTLKDIRDQVASTIKPYINDALLPQIERYFGFKTHHSLALKFDVDVQDVAEWILDNLRLGFNLTADGDSTLALAEAGTGVQSGALLALHRLEQQAEAQPDTQFILAVEEPEAFLHPQRQQELYADIRESTISNLRIIVTTHSPYVVAATPFSALGLVRREGQHSALHVADIKSPREEEVFNAYSTDVNAQLFFADKVVLVEGESDVRVLRLLLDKKFGRDAHRIAIISASGNRNFSPFLRMLRAWSTANIPHLVVTDFDSLTKESERALIKGAKEAGYAIAGETSLYAQIDGALDKGESDYAAVAAEVTRQLAAGGLNAFAFTSDLEYALLTEENKTRAASVFNAVSQGVDYTSGYDLAALRRNLGSKGVPLNPMGKPPFKKPFIHRKVADTIDLSQPHPDLLRLLTAIEEL